MGLGLLGGLGSSVGPGAGAGGGGGGPGAGPGLWGAGEGFVRREMSVATKLNLPPPLVRTGQQRPSTTLSPLSTAAAAGGGGGPLVGGVYPGSGGALAGLAVGGSTPGGSMRSFTEQVGLGMRDGWVPVVRGEGRAGRIGVPLRPGGERGPPLCWRAEASAAGVCRRGDGRSRE